ncbi:neutral zinc metallopeptidase [Fimbriiglobus ruber]|uniref:YpfJ protein, zinc metalloprotease superfamily n=1 Tax=Fimbriiglobus ruber TaxID=1908690 RepID=A0A225E0L9_9BACT|nr:neutral zinc metallopeptidase [Fimbriiglobus ruber]OWK44358.1 YpfJ protein, zinc metalloprotease superfamily [Fimbriiglobus ruber]
MKWEGGEESENVEDRRGMAKPAMIAGGGITTLLVLVAAYFLGIDPKQAQQVANQVGVGQQRAAQQEGQAPGKHDRALVFSKKILALTEKVWTVQFEKAGKVYTKPHMVLFDTEVDTKCGRAPSAVGPFYCPADRTLYLDPTFFDELAGKLHGSKADFSEAYVIAHEVGHHVQNLLGYSKIVDAKRGTREEKQYSVRLELQADYLAGVWAYHADKQFHILEDKDIDEALKTADAIGDDRLQKQAQGWVSPESFTHGKSAQRVKYFRLGVQTGDMSKLKLFFDTPYSEL